MIGVCDEYVFAELGLDTCDQTTMHSFSNQEIWVCVELPN